MQNQRLSTVTVLFQAANEVFEKLKDHMKILGSLCDQLSPLATTYADVRFFDVDVEQTQEEYENLMSEMNRELNDEKAFCEQQEQLTAEFGRIESEQLASHDKDQIIEVSERYAKIMSALIYFSCLIIFLDHLLSVTRTGSSSQAVLQRH